jgi:hypothetical protein
MTRLARWTLNALTALSLVLCVATIVVWVGTRAEIHRFREFRQRSGWDVFVGAGRCYAEWYRTTGNQIMGPDPYVHNIVQPGLWKGFSPSRRSETYVAYGSFRLWHRA